MISLDIENVSPEQLELVKHLADNKSKIAKQFLNCYYQIQNKPDPLSSSGPAVSGIGQVASPDWGKKR